MAKEKLRAGTGNGYCVSRVLVPWPLITRTPSKFPCAHLMARRKTHFGRRAWRKKCLITTHLHPGSSLTISWCVGGSEFMAWASGGPRRKTMKDAELTDPLFSHDWLFSANTNASQNSFRMCIRKNRYAPRGFLCVLNCVGCVRSSTKHEEFFLFCTLFCNSNTIHNFIHAHDDKPNFYILKLILTRITAFELIYSNNVCFFKRLSLL